MKTELTAHETGKRLYTAGGIAALAVLAGSLADIGAGMLLGVDLNTLPRTAAGRFAQLDANIFLGLYNLDLLNLVTTVLMVPCTVAIAYAHRKAHPAMAALALTLAVIGTSVFVSLNPALPLLELSRKYASAPDGQKTLLTAAGEAILARGEHGSVGVFPAFILPTLANIIMSAVMLKGKVFGKGCAWCGIAGNFCLFAYLVLVTFVPQTRSAVTLFAAPGGILAMVWLALSARALFRLEE